MDCTALLVGLACGRKLKSGKVRGMGSEMKQSGLSRLPARGTATAIEVLRQRFGDRLQTGEAIRQQHGHTLTWVPNQPPDAVLFVETAQDVSDAVQVARDYRMPIIPFGAGTSLEGHVNAPEGGLSLD